MTYDVKAIVKWSLKTKEQQKIVEEKVFQEIENIFRDVNFDNLDIKFSLQKRQNSNDIIKIKNFNWKYFLKQFSKNSNKFTFKSKGKKYSVKMNSQRYFLFRENNKCVCCGLIGTIVSCEKNAQDTNPHLNLYGVQNGNYILITKDHIKPKCSGGRDNHSNYQTMCSVCNGLKGHSNITLKNLYKLKCLYDKNKNVDKKLLHDLIEKAKIKNDIKYESYQSDTYVKNLSKDVFKTNCDLSIYKQGDKYFGMSVYDTPKKNYEYIGNIRRNIYIEPLFCYKNSIECQIHNLVISFHKSLLKK